MSGPIQGAVLSARPNSDFASILDALFAAPEDVEAATPTRVSVDYLAVADELHSGRIRVSGDAVEAQYRESVTPEGELAAVLAEVQVRPGERETDDLPPADPAIIATELALDSTPVPDFGQLRRAFALKNHPDRVPAHLRERALARMQIANRMIDDARRKALARAKG